MDTVVGVISDTHGLMRPEALAALHGVDVILHAGDVGALSVLRDLEGLAPVHAVCGNIDGQAFGLPAQLSLSFGACRSTSATAMSSEPRHPRRSLSDIGPTLSFMVTRTSRSLARSAQRSS